MQVPELQIQEVPYHIVNEEILREWQMTMIDNRRLSVDDSFCQHFFWCAIRKACCRVCTGLQYVLAVLICIAAVVAQQRHWNLQRQQQYKPYNIIIVFGTQACLEVFLFNICLPHQAQEASPPINPLQVFKPHSCNSRSRN